MRKPVVSNSLYTKLVSNFFFPLHEALKGHSSVKLHRELEQSQWLSPKEMEDRQNQNLQAFIARVTQHVPYYRELFDSLELKPQDIRCKAELARLPLLTKAIIRANQKRLKSTSAGKLIKYNTGGSSGQPLVFYMGMDRVSHDVASKWRATRWWGVDIGDPEIVLWGSPIELSGQDRIKQLRDLIIRSELISAFELDEETIQHTFKRIQKVRPPMLFGYPSVFALLAEEAGKRGLDLRSLGIKVIFVTSEKLYDHQRTLIETTFNAPVANGYGGRDAGFIAHQCPQGNFHITAEDIIVEIVDKAGSPLSAGEAGEIVVTHLQTSDFPFIRYATGDVGVLSNEACLCGRGLPLLKEIQGRSTDFIHAMDGSLMHGLALIYHVREHQGVVNFKIVQESLKKTTLYLQTNDEFDSAAVSQMVANFKKRLGEAVTVDVQVVDKMEREKSGKFRYVVSNMGK